MRSQIGARPRITTATATATAPPGDTMNTTITRRPPHMHTIRITISEDTYVSKEESIDGWEHREYRVWITYQGRTMSTNYSTGMAHSAGAVDATDVLYSIATDAESYRNAAGPLDFAREFGYEEDSTDARRVYRAYEDQWKKCTRVFGRDFSALLLWALDQ